jgi:hypothetical protein
VILPSGVAQAYTGGPTRAVVDGFDPATNRVYYSLWFYDGSGGAPQVYYFDLSCPTPSDPVRDKSLEHPETEPFRGLFPQNWHKLRTGLTKLHGLRDFEVTVHVRADSVDVETKWNQTQYRLNITVSTKELQQSLAVDAYCEPVVRVLGLYQIPGSKSLVAVVSRIGKAYGCEEIESPMLLEAAPTRGK